MINEGDMLKELRKISKILLLSNASMIEKELEKIATSDERRKMWVLINGSRTSKEIADKIGKTQRAVEYFLSAAVDADLVECKRGEPPQRLLDYVPPAWAEMISSSESEDEEKPVRKEPQATLDDSNVSKQKETGGK